MRVRGLVGALALVAAACGTTAAPTTTTTTTTTAVSPSSTTVSSTLATSSATPAAGDPAPKTPEPAAVFFSWPEADGPPHWTTTPLGIPGTTHVQVTHGPLGFLSLNNVSRGAVVRTSVDGVTWKETAILVGPDGEEQVSVDDMLVTDDEYFLTGEAWTNNATGSESFHNVLWRSTDGSTWSSMQLAELVPNAKAARLVWTSAGLVLAGMVLDPDNGVAAPRLWLERAGEWINLSASIPGFEDSGWVDGAVATGQGMILWGNDNNRTFVWSTPDLEKWVRGDLGENSSHIRHIAASEDGWVAVGSQGAFVSADAITWQLGASDEHFATDAVSEGAPGFGRLLSQDGYLVGVTQVGHRRAAAWCYEDPTDCRGGLSTVLVTPNGLDWRRLPLPGERPQPDHPVEAHGFLVDGRLAVVHTVGTDAVMSILETVENAVPINTGRRPNLPFRVLSPGDEILPGTEYGYPVWTHCGTPAIGPLNEVYWVGELVDSVEPFEVSGWGGYVLGFIELTADDEIEYRVDGRVIARYAPDPDYEIQFCY